MHRGLSNNFTRSNREKFNIATAILENEDIERLPPFCTTSMYLPERKDNDISKLIFMLEK